MRIAVISIAALAAAGVAAMVAFHTFVNIGMTVGVLPITGMTLPFVSYGGSSLVTAFLLVGLVVNVASRRWPRSKPSAAMTPSN